MLDFCHTVGLGVAHFNVEENCVADPLDFHVPGVLAVPRSQQHLRNVAPPADEVRVVELVQVVGHAEPFDDGVQGRGVGVATVSITESLESLI